ncbi:MAG: hypothetical protein JWR34_7430 [Mycobacterium sp.]|nr:hypothetical protein [Mycobacterium sp.]
MSADPGMLDLDVFAAGQAADGMWWWSWDGPHGAHLRSATVFDSSSMKTAVRISQGSAASWATRRPARYGNIGSREQRQRTQATQEPP